MEKRDLRSSIIPTVLENLDDKRETGNNDFNTEDLIYIESYDDNGDRLVINKFTCTDYAVMNNAQINDFFNKNKVNMAYKWLRTPYYKYNVYYSGGYGQATSTTSIGICPALHFKIPVEGDSFLSNLNIRKVFDERKKCDDYILDLGEYPKTKVDEKLSSELEALYNNGNLNDGLICTGRWYSNNGLKDGSRGYAGKHSPEFEYMGKRYVRVFTIPNEGIDNRYSDHSSVDEIGAIKWVNVEPITFIIKNWDDLPNYINSKGSGKTDFFDLVSENVILANLQFYPNGYDDNANMWQNSTIRGYLNGIDVRNITENGNPNFPAVDGGNFSSECNFLNEAFNLSREPVIQYTIPDSEKIIPNSAFNGCVGNNVTIIDDKAIDNKNIVLSDEMPKIKDKNIKVYELNSIVNAFDNFDYNVLTSMALNQNDILNFASGISRSKIKMSYKYLETLIKKRLGNELINNSVFKFFGNENPKLNDMFEGVSDVEKISFWKFCNTLGCFSKQKMLDRDGKETEVIMAQKASTFLSSLLKNQIIKPGEFYTLFEKMDYNVNPNQDFLNFITVQDNKKSFPNLRLLLDMENKYTGIFFKAMSEFDKLKLRKDTVDLDGNPVTISWEEALKSFYNTISYKNVTLENEDLAATFTDKGITQDAFNKAVELRKKFVKDNIPNHILGEPLKEESILESIERIKMQIDHQLVDSKEMIDELYSKQFTYEWLNKNDPKNYIIGIYSNCCATIMSSLYGKEIVGASVSSPDVQTIVVRNPHGDIISKGTMYVNRDAGYAVINDFELNRQYRKIDTNNMNYLEEKHIKESHVKELILQAFKRGVDAFVQKYNAKNPDKPIKQVNVGIGYNKLADQLNDFYEKGELLKVPEEYCFKDAEKGQYVLYIEDEKNDDFNNLDK